MPIRRLTHDDLDGFVAHVVRHMKESGTDGGPRFAPFDKLSKTPSQIRERNAKAWSSDVGAEGWKRVWAAFSDAGEIMGHADLRHRGFDNTEHRCLLGMGVVKPYRRRGLGGALLETVVSWARSEGFVWLDLFVLADNTPAQALYRRAGFVEVSRYDDFFRIAGEKVGDIGMTLKLD